MNNTEHLPMVSVKEYCAEFTKHVDKAKQAKHEEMLLLDIETNCGQNIKELVLKQANAEGVRHGFSAAG